MELNVILPLAGGLAVVAILAVVFLVKNRTAYLGPVREELQKEKGWLRRGEYNAAMVKGRQNLELLLKLVAEKNGIQLDNSAKALEEAERQIQSGRKKTLKVMTHRQFNHWLMEHGYIDRVARWEMNQVRMIGNKAVHENHADKDDAWTQLNYLEDVLKTITERSQNPKKRQELSKKQEQDDAQKKPQQKKKPQEKKKPEEKKAQEQKEAPEQEPAKKKKRKRRKKSGQAKQNAQNVQTVQTEQEPAKKKRRRRRKPSQKKNESAAGTPVVEEKVPVKEKAPAKEKTPVEVKPEQETEKKKRRRRRRRPRKPSGEQE